MIHEDSNHCRKNIHYPRKLPKKVFYCLDKDIQVGVKSQNRF